MNRHRLRERGVTLGRLPTGPRNLITDVPGVTVGHRTVDTDRQKTGVTVIRPTADNVYTRPLTAAAHVINGYGKSAGLVQICELGTLETPIALCGTLNVGKVCDALVGYTLDLCSQDGTVCRSVNPVVGETNDGTLSCNGDRPVGDSEVRAALAEAAADFALGDVGAGKGTVCHGLKGGIGSASRVVEIGGRAYTVGVLVQTNYGCIEDLRIDGRPVGRAVLDLWREEEAAAQATIAETSTAQAATAETDAAETAAGTACCPVEGQDDIGSIMVVVATDLPVSDRQLTRILRRATVGLARMGSHIGHGSGDVVLGFTTANRPTEGEEVLRHVAVLREDALELPFCAVAECVEEAIADSLLCADRVTGYNASTTVTVRALGEFWPEAWIRAGRMAGTTGMAGTAGEHPNAG